MVGINLPDGALADHRVGVLLQGVGPLLRMLGVSPGWLGELDELCGAGLEGLGFGVLELLFTDLLALGCGGVGTVGACVTQGLGFVAGCLEGGGGVGAEADRLGLAMIHVPEEPTRAAVLGDGQGETLAVAEQGALGRGGEGEVLDFSDLGSNLEVSEFVDRHAGNCELRGWRNTPQQSTRISKTPATSRNPAENDGRWVRRNPLNSLGAWLLRRMAA